MANFNLLLESGDDLLLESGDVLELESPETSPPPEVDIETIVIAILNASAVLSGEYIEHWREDASTAAKGNRITVRCDPKVAATSARSSARKAPVWRAEVTITVQHNGTETELDNWQEAIDEAMMPAAEEYPASIITLGAASFPNGIEFLAATGGDRFSGSADRRTLTRVYPVLFRL